MSVSNRTAFEPQNVTLRQTTLGVEADSLGEEFPGRLHGILSSGLKVLEGRGGKLPQPAPFSFGKLMLFLKVCVGILCVSCSESVAVCMQLLECLPVGALRSSKHNVAILQTIMLQTSNTQNVANAVL